MNSVSVKHLSANTPTDRIMALLARDGGVILDQFVQPDHCDVLARDFRKSLETESWNNTENQLPDSFFGYKTKRLHGLAGLSSTFEAVLTDSRILEMARMLFGTLCNDVIMSTSELIAIGPGEKQQQLHRDGDTWEKFPQPRPELLLSINVALTPFTQENGATVVLPGSHKPEAKISDSTARVCAEMETGSALLYTGNLVHSGGANATTDTRVGMYIGYIPDWLRPLENSSITVPEPCLKGLSETAQKLLGYSASGFNVVF